MRLSNALLREITVGAVEIKEDSDGRLRFCKYTESQMSGFGPWNEKSPVFCTTGIRLDFHTNSKKFVFVASLPGKYELYIDGLLRRQFKIAPAEKGGEFDVLERIETDLCDVLGGAIDECRVTLYLPSHAIGQLDFVELDDGAFVKKHSFSRKFLMIGDSLTQGWDSVFDSLSYASRVSRFFDAESIIQGRGGSCYKVETLEKLPGFDPDVVTVAYGTNDFSRCHTLEEMKENVSAYLDKLCEIYGDKKVFIISPIWRESQERPMGSFRDCCALVGDEAKKRGFIHVDGLSLVPPMCKELYTDGLHLNDLGFSFYSENLIRVINEYVK